MASVFGTIYFEIQPDQKVSDEQFKRLKEKIETIAVVDLEDMIGNAADSCGLSFVVIDTSLDDIDKCDCDEC